MEIKDIENIIERYFQGQTTEQEEALLREAFANGNVSAEAAFYKDYFLGLQEEADVKMSAEFDARLRNRLALMESSRTAAVLKSVFILIVFVPRYRGGCSR